jgi:HAD superfamily hydrolase (TIGR01509 family)
MTIKAVIFDMDGVLIDARDWHFEALNEALSIFGFQIGLEEHLKRFDGLSTRKKLQILSDDYNLPRNIHTIIESIKQDRTIRIAAQKCFPNAMHLILLESLQRQGIQIGMVTNSISITAEFMTSYAGIRPFLKVLVTNEDVMHQKPHPEGYIQAMEKLKVSPYETLIIEDGEYGAIAATKSGGTLIRVSGVNQVNLELLTPYIPELGA